MSEPQQPEFVPEQQPEETVPQEQAPMGGDETVPVEAQPQETVPSSLQPQAPRNHDIVIKNFPFEATEVEIRKKIEEYGEILSMKYPCFRETGKFRGLVFVTMKDPEAKPKILSGFNGMDWGGRTLSADNALPSGGEGGPVTEVFCGGWDFETTTEADIRKLFEGCGEIKDIRVPMNHTTGKPRGFSFIEFADPSSVEAALKMNGTELNGRSIIVNEERKKKRGGPRRFGRDRYSGYGYHPYGRGDRGYDRDRGYNRGGYDRDRGYNRGGYDRGYDRRDRGGYDRGYDRRDNGYDRGYDRRDRGGYDRDDNRGGYDRGYN